MAQAGDQLFSSFYANTTRDKLTLTRDKAATLAGEQVFKCFYPSQPPNTIVCPTWYENGKRPVCVPDMTKTPTIRPHTSPATSAPFREADKAGEEIFRSFYPYRIGPDGKKMMSEDEASAKISAGMKGMHTRKKMRQGRGHELRDPDRKRKILERKQRLAEGKGTVEDKMKDKEYQRARHAGMTDDEAAAKIAAGMKGLHTRKMLKQGNTDRYRDGDRAHKISRKRKKRHKKPMTDDEASAKIAAGMKGMSTRKKIKAGNADQFADADRAEKVAARKQRIAEGKATEADKAEDKEFQKAKAAGMTDDEAAAKIAAGMQGMMTRKKIKAGNADQFADADRESKIQARKDKKQPAEE